jgi:hypothetical protein
MMVARKPGHQGEREGNRNTVAQGMPVATGEPVADYPVHFLHEPRVIRTPGIPCALFSSRDTVSAADLGVDALGKRGGVSAV